MTPFVYQQMFAVHRGKPEMVSIVGGSEPSVDCKAFSTLVLQESGSHRRKIKKFVVVLGEVERAQIGWAHVGSSYSCFGADLNADHKGPGEEASSVALDGFRGSVVCKGEVVVSVPELSLQAGSVVHCDMTSTHFSWMVDGKQVATVALDMLAKDTSSDSARGLLICKDMLYPVVAGKGQWHVSQFEYH